MAGDKRILEAMLGELLGFEDGAADVLDHLLSIESKDDLLEYLTQLLGDSNPGIPEFVDAVGRFQRGEPFETSAQYEISRDLQNMAIEESTEVLPPAVEPPAASSNKKHLQPSQSKSRQNQKQSKSRVPPPKIKSKQKEPPGGSSSIASVGKNAAHNQGADGLDRQAKSKAAEKAKTIVKSRPQRGKATTVCGCYGTHHDPLTNCLYCGRISCVEEGYSFCAFCGYMVEEVRDDGKDHGDDPNWARKERLLRFDRDFARRTEIFDDQADFLAPSTWMTEEERIAAEEKQEEQQNSLKRPKQVLNLSL